jgi:iron-sulfur cluster repair protein YtfE (RIC family)
MSFGGAPMIATITPDEIEGLFLDHEHARVRAGLAGIRDTIEEAHHLGRIDTSERVVRTLTWIRRDVLPHAAWEEAWLYPHLDQAAATPWATRALRFEHDQIRDVAAILEQEFQDAGERWSAELIFRLVVALTRLETLVSAHLAKEERFVIPLLEVAQPENVDSDVGARRTVS